jgi:uncharacterized oxidoreductase
VRERKQFSSLTQGSLRFFASFQLESMIKLTGNTIFITGSGIGRGLADALHKLGNQINMSGRRTERVRATIAANPSKRSVALDITDSAAIKAAANKLFSDYQ